MQQCASLVLAAPLLPGLPLPWEVDACSGANDILLGIVGQGHLGCAVAQQSSSDERGGGSRRGFSCEVQPPSQQQQQLLLLPALLCRVVLCHSRKSCWIEAAGGAVPAASAPSASALGEKQQVAGETLPLAC